MKLSVLMPVYNEAATLTEIVRRVRAVDLPLELIIVDDGSTDGSRQILEALPATVATVLFHEQNRGKGAAIRTALAHARGELVIVQDADLEYDPEDYHALVRPIVEGRARVVYGSRIMHLGNPYSHLRYYVGGRLVSLVTRLLYGIRITDEPTCYKLIPRALLEDLDLECTGFEFCPEVTAKIARRGIPIVEVPIRYQARSFAQGKKISWTDGLRALWILLKYRFGPAR